jgi:CRISPR-associated protein Csm1
LADKVAVISLNGEKLNCEFMRLKGINNIYGLEFYGGNQTDNSRFEKLITADHLDSDSFKRLGVLRMDVDNLGTIFQEGLNNPTLSRYSALSRSFDYFFCGYLNKIQQEVSRDNSFIIYSGGDDVFIVADWKHAIETAKRIHNDFKEFACQNPDFTISGGISIIDPRYPIMKAASDSADEESSAKKHKFGEGEFEKNAISFMNFPVNWDEEFPVIEELKETLCGITDLPSSFRQKVLQFWAMAEFKENKVKPDKYRIYWLMAYDLGRFKQRHKDNQAIINLVDNCINECCGKKQQLNGKAIKTKYHPLELWAFACRWAELELRSK